MDEYNDSESMLALECVCIDSEETVQPLYGSKFEGALDNQWIVNYHQDSSKIFTDKATMCVTTPHRNLSRCDILSKTSALTKIRKATDEFEDNLQITNSEYCQSHLGINDNEGESDISKEVLGLSVQSEVISPIHDMNIMSNTALDDQPTDTFSVDVKPELKMEEEDARKYMSDLPHQPSHFAGKNLRVPSRVLDDNLSPDACCEIPIVSKVPRIPMSFEMNVSRHVDKCKILCEVCGRSFAHKHNLKHHYNTFHLQCQQSDSRLDADAVKTEEYIGDLDTQLNTSNDLVTNGSNLQHYPHDKFDYDNADYHGVLDIDANQGHFKSKSAKRLRRTSSDSATELMTETFDGLQQFPCALCAAPFDTAASLKLHISSTHSDRSTYVCGDCGKSYTTAASLRMHALMVHNQHRCVCEICGKYYASKYYLKLHRKIHAEIKDYTCSFCEKGFIDQQALRLHLRTHTGERPFPCPDCGRGFTQSSHLKTHLRTHTGEKPYKCSVCGKHFRQQSNVMEHERTHRNRSKEIIVIHPPSNVMD